MMAWRMARTSVHGQSDQWPCWCDHHLESSFHASGCQHNLVGILDGYTGLWLRPKLVCPSQ